MPREPARGRFTGAGFVVRVLRLASGEPTPIDGQWLVEYDPFRPGLVGRRVTLAHLVCAPDAVDARRFGSQAALFEYVQRSPGKRPDGFWQRPIMAYHLASYPIDDDGRVDGVALFGGAGPPRTERQT